jgi:hypothetical protein
MTRRELMFFVSRADSLIVDSESIPALDRTG